MVEQVRQARLIGVGENSERRQIMAERLQAPFLRVEIAERNAAVVFENGGAVIDQEAAHLREIAAVHQVGRAFEKAVGGTEFGAEFQEAGNLHAAVGQVGAEVIERLVRSVAVGKND